MAHAAKGDALQAAGRYREAIDSYGRALMLAPNSILVGLPMAYNLYRLSRNRPSPMPTRRCGSVRTPPARQWPTLYLAKAIAFGMLQDHEQALVWIERAEAAAPEILVMGFVRSALLAMAGKEDEARAAMQRYLANDNAPIRTMSQWRARQSENRCRPIIRLFLRVFLYRRRNSTMASEQPDCRSDQRGCPRRRGDRTSVFAALMSNRKSRDFRQTGLSEWQGAKVSRSNISNEPSLLDCFGGGPSPDRRPLGSASKPSHPSGTPARLRPS